MEEEWWMIYEGEWCDDDMEGEWWGRREGGGWLTGWRGSGG